MATKDSATIGDFFVTSWCRRNGSWTGKIPLSSNDVEHVLEFENGSTLPYDVQATTVLPDAPPHTTQGTIEIEFSHGRGARQTSWHADIPQVGSGDTEKDVATTHCVTTTNTSVRIHTTKVEYRLDSSSAWEDDPTCTDLPIDIRLDVE